MVSEGGRGGGCRGAGFTIGRGKGGRVLMVLGQVLAQAVWV